MFSKQYGGKKDEQYKQILRSLLSKKTNTNLTIEQMDSLWNLADLMVDIASGEFKCQSCGGKFQMYAINLGK